MNFLVELYLNLNLGCLQSSILFRLFLYLKFYFNTSQLFPLIISLYIPYQIIRILLAHEIEHEIGIEKYHIKAGQARSSVRTGTCSVPNSHKKQSR